jgi:RNA polymerase sigma-70 factor (ECF subfamily)
MSDEFPIPRDGLRSLRERFVRLYAEHHPALHALAMRRCRRDRAAADDLLQDTYERAWRRFDSLRDPSRALAWLAAILHNCWVSARRRSSRYVQVAEPLDIAPAPADPARWRRVSDDQLRRVLEQLEEPYRSVAILRDVEQLPTSTIARRLSVPNATVATRLHRAHIQVRRLLPLELDRWQDSHT